MAHIYTLIEFLIHTVSAVSPGTWPAPVTRCIALFNLAHTPALRLTNGFSKSEQYLCRVAEREHMYDPCGTEVFSFYKSLTIL